jgi:hypothetical protein
VRHFVLEKKTLDSTFGVARVCCTVKFSGTIGMSVTVPTDCLEPPLVPLFTRDKQPVAAVRSRLSGSIISKFDCSKLPGDQYAPFDAMGLTAADPKAVLAAADAVGVPGAAIMQRFNDHLRSPTDVMTFDLIVRHPLATFTPFSPSGKAAVIIDLFSRGDDVVNRLNKTMYGYRRSGRNFVASPFPSPLR